MKYLPLVAALAALGTACASAEPPSTQQSDASRSLPAPSGDFTIITTRRASDVAGGPIEKEAAGRIGETVSFGETLTWWDGTTCRKWSAERKEERVLPLDDPNLSDTQLGPEPGPVSAGDRRLNAGWSLTCDGENLGVLLQVDRRVLVVPTRSGITNLILEKPLSPDETLKFQKQLKSMKFFEGEPARNWDEASLSAVASYAEYRGAKFRFARTAITENLLDGLMVLAAQPISGDPGDWEELKVVINGDVSAHFWGERLELVPLTYGVQELRFTFEGDPKSYPFKPEGTLYASDWTFDIYSPDGDHVLLLQDRFGPYHLVPLDDLKAYLKGEKEPAHVIGQKADEDQPAAVHGNARWRSPFELEYTVTCCGTKETRRYNVRFPDYRPKETPDTLLDYRPSLSGDVLALPAARPENLKALIGALKTWSKKADKKPGAWEDGNVALGADPKEYVPSDPELMVSEIGDRISHIVLNTNSAELAKIVKKQGIKARKIHYMRFTFRHVDVMGSGRFFYANPPKPAAITISTGNAGK